MIRPLRRRHLWLILGAGLVVAPLYIAALAARPAHPVAPDLVDELEGRGGSPVGEVAAELRSDPPIRLASLDNGAAVLLTAEEAVDGAGLLLYWLPAGARFSERAVLVGAVRGHGRQALPLPEPVVEPGSLVLYSLGHAEEIARVGWPPAAGGAP
jgi:hypothetical protein